MKKSARYVRTQLADAIESYIVQNQLKPGDRLPSERDLSELWNVSRMTVRSAINKLIDEGLLVRKPGSGTFVAPQKVILNLGTPSSFKKLIEMQNFQYETVILNLQTIESDKELSKLFSVNLGTELIRITRKRIVEQLPFSLEISYLVKSKVPAITSLNLSKDSLFDVLENQYGIKLKNQQHFIRTVPVSRKYAENLGLEENEVCLYLSSSVIDEEGNTVIHTKEWVRPDRCVVTSVSKESDY